MQKFYFVYVLSEIFLQSSKWLGPKDGQDGQEPLEAHCEAVSQNDGSVQYECQIIQTTPATKQKTKDSTTMPRVTGKFSLNLP